MKLLVGATITLGLLIGTTAVGSRQNPTPDALAWQPSNGPIAGNVQALVESQSGTLFALASRELFRSADDGASWQRCESQPIHASGGRFDPWLASSGRVLYSSGGSGGPVYVSQDECVTSGAIPAPPRVGASLAESMTIAGHMLIATEGDRVFALNGEALTGLGRDWIELPVPKGSHPRVFARGTTIFLIQSQTLFCSNDRGQTWSPVGTGGLRFDYLVTGGTSLYAAAFGGPANSAGVWRSTDGGETWARMIESGFTALTARGSAVYASVFNPAAIARSLDDGRTWTKLPRPSQQPGIATLLQTRQGTLLAGTVQGIYRSINKGETWAATGVRGQRVVSMAAGSGAAYVSMGDGSLWTSRDAGLTWTRVDARRPGAERFSQWPVPFTKMLLAPPRLSAATDRELFASDDGGITWSTSGLTQGVTAIARLDSTWFVATYAGVFRSDDLLHWSEASNGLSGGAVFAITATPSGDLVVLQDFWSYRSTDGGRSWWPLPQAPVFPGIEDGPRFRNRPMLVSDETIGTVLLGDGIAQLSLPERKWIIRADQTSVTAVVKDGQGRYWIGTRSGVARFYVRGTDWRVASAGLDGPVTALTIDPTGYLLAAVDKRGVFRAKLPSSSSTDER